MKRQGTEYLRHDNILAEVPIEIHEVNKPDYNSTMSLTEVRKLEKVRKALVSGDLSEVADLAKFYRLTPLSVSASSATDAA